MDIMIFSINQNIKVRVFNRAMNKHEISYRFLAGKKLIFLCHTSQSLQDKLTEWQRLKV